MFPIDYLNPGSLGALRGSPLIGQELSNQNPRQVSMQPCLGYVGIVKVLVDTFRCFRAHFISLAPPCGQTPNICFDFETTLGISRLIETFLAFEI